MSCWSHCFSLSKENKMQDSDFSLSSLLCEENETCFDEIQCNERNPDFVFDENDDGDEFIQRLFERERTSFGSKSYDGCLALKEGWLKGARLDAIEWILNARLVFGFQFNTVYLSVIFFDQFLSKRSICEGKVWAIRLLAVACLSIAAKIEELKVPPLSGFCINEFEFVSIVIQRMELLVLSTLEWKVALVTPHSYIPYLVRELCGESRLTEMVSRAIELVKLIIKEVNLMDHGPSIIAAATVLAASDNQLTREAIELKMSSVSSLRLLNNVEHIFGIYNLILGLGVGDRTPDSLIFSDASSIHSSPGLSCSASGTKRRLTYDESNEEYPAKKN